MLKKVHSNLETFVELTTIGNSISLVHGLELASEATRSKEKEKLNSRGLCGRAMWIILHVFLPRNFLSIFLSFNFSPPEDRGHSQREISEIISEWSGKECE